MAAFAVTQYVTPYGTLEEVAANIVTKLETLDSTTNAVQTLQIFQLTGGAFKGVIIYNG